MFGEPLGVYVGKTAQIQYVAMSAVCPQRDIFPPSCFQLSRSVEEEPQWEM